MCCRMRAVTAGKIMWFCWTAAIADNGRYLVSRTHVMLINTIFFVIFADVLVPCQIIRKFCYNEMA